MQSFRVMVPFFSFWKKFISTKTSSFYESFALIVVGAQGLIQLEVETSKSKISMLINPFDDMCIQTHDPTCLSFLLTHVLAHAITHLSHDQLKVEHLKHYMIQ